uniref:Uncharacterized protein n=1 Tax=Leptocylindrus danicus TaxID=163516 RepID=A0A7S2LQ95_9STRA|mmetsp:Transcript_8077/g.12023  ORF Transcript_8077/g.12023 Transcript_8077/m.12023 type:complete len:186 (+) Transcript_8077:71-628(+)
MRFFLYFCFSGASAAFVGNTLRRQQISSTGLSMGFFDDLAFIFSEEGKKNRAAYDERERAEMEEAQRIIIERRKNPEKMAEYEQKIMEKRAKLQEERDVWDFQNRVQDGFDPLTEWNTLRKEGKIQVGSDLERDEGSRRLGSEGLVDVRVDERMPYIDQGYVDEDADVMGNFMKLFGGKKKKDEE